MNIFSLSILLPIAFFVLLVLHGASGWREESRRDWRYAFLIATVVWGVILALSTELLGLLNALSRPGLALVWLLALAGLYWWSDGFGRIPAVLYRVRQEAADLQLWQQALLMGLVTLFGLLFAVAWVSPPNNVDSLLYHMSRVMHWTQNQSVAHYPAVFHHQLNMPPWSEEAILHLRVLFGDDRPASLMQWFSMLGAVVGAGFIAKRLGAGRVGQALSMVFVATLPMALLQATSTQNDLVVAFWMVASLAFVLDGLENSGSKWIDVRVGAAIGLGLLTKSTFYIYALPVAVGFVIFRLTRNGRKKGLVSGAVVVLTVLSLNAGFWGRNLQTYGDPLGGVIGIRENLLESASWEGHDGGIAPISVRVGSNGLSKLPRPYLRLTSGPFDCCQMSGGFLLQSGVGGDLWRWLVDFSRRSVSDVFLHFVTPSSALNAMIESNLRQIPWLLKGDYFSERAAAAWNHEDTAGNPLHLILIGISVPVLLVRWKSDSSREVKLGYVAMLLAGFTMLTSFFEAPRIYELRYHLAFFVCAGPLVGVALDPMLKNRLHFLISLGLTFALPWVLLNNMRPVVGMPPWPTRTESVFTIPKQEVLLAIAPHAVDDYSAAAQRITESQCRQVGLAIGQQDLEYAFWWLLDAPQSGIRIEVINPSPQTARYVDPDFEPCAVLCTRCGAVEDQLESMNYEGTYDNFDLYLAGSGG